ncbi:MAG TPA: metal-dependent hydrolase [Thermoanaerobaculia bacterium]|jgi:L-ascorbate metabolism protein UlaG (beta-lactamase superfamily)|nr:metal-dependent hydrolase [Thermoanaerobaculia bacterium]
MAPFEGRLTWLGHAMFAIESKSGQRLVVDPFIEQNPKFPKDFDLSRVDVIAATHGHFDHFGGSGLDLARRTGAAVCGIFELALWLGEKGYENVSGMNKGGTQTIGDFTIHMTQAVHSSGTSRTDQNPPSDPCGYVVDVGGFRIYHAGDTAVFSDMALIAELLRPDVALLPIGDFYTMGPASAAKACELLKVATAIPMHFGTFPALTGTAEAFRAEVEKRGLATRVVALSPGESWRG